MRIGHFVCFFSITLLTILCFTNIPIHSQCLHDQKSLLLQFKSSITFDPNYSVKLVNWTQANDCCQWMGVSCDQSGHVIGLDLNNESISNGPNYSTSLFSLQHLESLNLAFNNFGWTQIPSNIGNLTNLTYLNLSNAGFGEQIPIGLSLLTRLTVLDLSSKPPSFGNFNLLEIKTPNLSTLFRNHSGVTQLYLDGVNISANRFEWGQAISLSLPNLRVLSLRDCSLSGPIDSSLQNLQLLSEINLDSNNLSTSVPDFFVNFSNLTALRLIRCNLCGTFPAQILQVKTLQSLDLTDNSWLQGSLPKFHQSGSLQNLQLSNTSFSGILPNSIGNLIQLVHLDLSYNSFNGSIPSSLFSLPSLKEIHLSNNQFCQISQFSNGSLSPLEKLDLSCNKLEGPIPPYFFDFQMLDELSLSFNNFNGTMRLESIQRLRNLITLDLSHNNLSVDVSVNISSLSNFPQLIKLGLVSCNLHNFPALMNQSQLSDLDLSDNQIPGEIPNWIWNITKLEYLNLSCNLLVGLQSEYIMPDLSVLDVHSNQLRGEIPLLPKRAMYVDYSNNSFSYSIPVDIGNNLSWLFSLSNNKLFGPIPQSICNGFDLRILDLSNNNLSGNIPQCLIDILTMNLDVLNLQNNNLTGNIKGTFPEGCTLTTLDLSGNHLEGQVPKSLVNCTNMEVLNLGTNNINGNFPCFLTKLSSLRILILRSNKFQGNIRCRGIHNNIWPKLQIIDLAVNNFTGILPPKFFLQRKAMTDRSNAQLLNHFLFWGPSYQDSVIVVNKGSDMKLVKILTIYTVIDFSENNFEGEIPDSVGDLKSLYVLNLSHNGLTGSIPSSFGNLRELESLDLSWNKLNGSIPTTLASLTFLSFLNLSYNQLVGMIPRGPQLQTFSETSFEGNEGLCGAPLIATCRKATKLTTSSMPTFDEGEINWVYIAATLGYTVGLGAIVGPLLYWKRWRECYYKHVDRVVFRILDHYENWATHQRRRDNKNLIRRRQHG